MDQATSTYVGDDELEICPEDAQRQGRKRESPVRVARPLHSSKNESNNIGPCADAHDALVRDLVLDHRADDIGQNSDNDHRQHVHAGHESIVAKNSLEVECNPEGECWEAEKTK